MKHILNPSRFTLIFMGMLIGTAAVLILWPQTALADDCLRDPFDAEDCLRTAGWAPVLAGGLVWLASVFTSFGEIRNTLSSIRNGIPQITASSGGGGLKHKGWWTRISESLLGVNETIGAVSPEEAERQRKRAAEIRRIARASETPVRVMLGIAGVGGLFLTPWVGIPLLAIAVFYPDILSPIIGHIAGEDD